jgi:hypothetical protein
VRKAVPSIANPFNIDWDIQKNSDAACEVRHFADAIEKIRALPLSSSTRQTNDAGETSGSGYSLGSGAGDDSAEISSSSIMGKNTGATSLEVATSSESLQEPDYRNLPYDMLRAFASGIGPEEFTSALDIRRDHITINLNMVQKWGEKAVHNLSPRKQGSVRVVDGSHLDVATWPVHTLLDPQSGQTVGLWAPDISEADDYMKPRRDISCLAVSRRKEHIWCLGLVPTGDGNEGHYKRVGLAYWNVKDWDMRPPAPLAGVKIV